MLLLKNIAIRILKTINSQNKHQTEESHKTIIKNKTNKKQKNKLLGTIYPFTCNTSA